MAINNNLKPVTNGAFEVLANARVTSVTGTSGTFQAATEDQEWERDTYIYSDKPLRIVISTGADVAPTPPAGILIPNFTLIKLKTLVVDAESCGWASNDLKAARVWFGVDLDSGTDPEA